ncbi:MAG: ATP-dependent zinc metalloprotease FtsH [Candidatus Obscuribacterales bacterium]|nr:ATP-dependent zinc metalloprotease FtsH [Candidatus Obscuribacterales bacterium]
MSSRRPTLSPFFWLLILFILGATFVFPALQSNGNLPPPKPTINDFSGLVSVLDEKPATLSEITVLNGTNKMRIKSKDGQVSTVVIPSKAGEALVLEKANQAKVTVAASEPTGSEEFLGFLGGILPWLLIGLVLLFFFGRALGNANPARTMTQARGPRNQGRPTQPRKTFADVAGCDEAKVEAQEIIDYLRNPGSFGRLGARPPKGVLLVGPPGTGKTLLAKAIAGEAEAFFFEISASQFVEMFVGVGAARVRSQFDMVRQNRPAILFIDELDAVGRQRGAGIGGGNDEREQTLNQLLIEMDGFNDSEGVIILAATNRADVLDPALVRPGRFDRQILVDAPDVVGREAIFKIHTRNKPLANEVSLRFLAERCPGFTGAEIEGSCNEAATVATRRYNLLCQEVIERNGSDAELQAVPAVITLADFDEGIDRVQLGIAKVSRAKSMSAEDMNNTSIHELGHGLLSEVLEHGDDVTKITIIPRSRALGYTQALPSGDRYNYTQEQLHARIVMIMGGRAAQEVLLGTIDTGASNDFQQAYGIARRMVTEWGMSKLGPLSVSGNNTNPFLGRSMSMPAEAGPVLQDRIDTEVQCIINGCLVRAKELIEKHRDFMTAANAVLLKHETILKPQWQELLAEHGVERHTLKVNLNCGGEACEEPAAS